MLTTARRTAGWQENTACWCKKSGCYWTL